MCVEIDMVRARSILVGAIASLITSSIVIPGTLQAQLDSVYAEVFYVDDGSIEGYPCGYTTFRLYAVMSSSNYDVRSIIGAEEFASDWFFGSDGDGIWNTSWGGVIGDELNPLWWSFQPAAAFDSFITIHKASQDDEGSQLVTSLLEYEYTLLEETFGVPNPDLDESGTALHLGGNMLMEGTGGLHAIDPVGTPAFSDGPQLLAQVTTNGIFSWRINLNIHGPDVSGIQSFYHSETTPEGISFGEIYGMVGSINPVGDCPETCFLPEDLNGSGVVDVPDILDLLAQFGCSGCSADLDGDGFVLVSDLLQVLGALWQSCD